MNIFFLDRDPKTCAQSHCDKHVVKMTLETAQMLCTAHRTLDGNWGNNHLYKSTHIAHPSCKWVRDSIQHYVWTADLFYWLSWTYHQRYNREHKSFTDFWTSLERPPVKIEDNGWTDPPQCMDDCYKRPNTVDAYRTYYSCAKSPIAEWNFSQRPAWMDLNYA